MSRDVIFAGRRARHLEVSPPARAPMWWRPDGVVPDDPALIASLVAYLSAVTLTEPAYAARGGVGASAQRDHSVWFHARAALSDWLLYDRSSPSSTCAGTGEREDVQSEWRTGLHGKTRDVLPAALSLNTIGFRRVVWHKEMMI